MPSLFHATPPAVGEQLQDSSDSTERNLGAMRRQARWSVGGCGVLTAACHVDGWRCVSDHQTDIKSQVAFTRSHNLYIKQATSNSAGLNLWQPTRETGPSDISGSASRSRHVKEAGSISVTSTLKNPLEWILGVCVQDSSEKSRYIDR